MCAAVMSTMVPLGGDEGRNREGRGAAKDKNGAGKWRTAFCWVFRRARSGVLQGAVSDTALLNLVTLAEFHSSPMGGHFGETKTYQRMASEVYWPRMRRDVAKFVWCIICQRNKHSATTPAGLLQPLPLPAQARDDVSMDFIEGLPRSGRVDSILVVVDRLSKYTHFVGLNHPFTQASVAGVFLREIVRLHGIPHSIVSD